MAAPGKRLKILTGSEIRELYGLPEFNSEERAEYFALSQAEEDILSSLRSIRSKVYFILQLGYFKAKKMFFVFSFHGIEKNIKYILRKYFYHRRHELKNLKLSKPTRLSQQKQILELHKYRVATEEIREKLEEKANFFVSIHSKPINVFRELLSYLETHRVDIPGYSVMQDVECYTVQKMKRVNRETAYLYLLCFIFIRYQKINDNLTKTFLYYVGQFLANARQIAKEKGKRSPAPHL